MIFARAGRLAAAIGLLALGTALLSPAVAPAAAPSRAPVPTAEQIRDTVLRAAVRIEIGDDATRTICTGWVGWSEVARSVAYTAGHCFRAGARYRIVIAGSDIAEYATNLTRWETLDLMVLWFPRGGLPALRVWKPMPTGPFRAVYVLSERGGPLRLVDITVPRIPSEIRFYTHPMAVAIPLPSAPGTSGAPVVDLDDGALLGMIVGYAFDRPALAAVIPAQSIYDALTAPTRR